MGQFSWICSDTNRQLLNDTHADTYLLVPKPFQEKYGKTIYEGYYDGYGRFGGYDVYNLIPEWNKEMIPEIIRRIKNGTWFCNATESDVKDLLNYYSGEEIGCDLRHLGIIMACYDEDNFSLEYPIKITTMEMEYENVSPSKLLYGWGEGYTRSQQSIWLKFIAIVSTNGNASYLSNLFYNSSKSFG